MKTAIVQLDAFDNVISIREKIVWSKTQRILLVWPNKGIIKLKAIDIILILRSAESQGAQIAVVTDEPVIKNQLKKLGISLFSSIPEAQKKPWRKPKIRDQALLQRKADQKIDLKAYDKQRQLHHVRLSKFVRWLIFSVGLFSTLLIILIFVPSATIVLYPVVDEQSLQMKFRSDPTVKEINVTGAVPFDLIDIEIDGQVEGESTGIIRVPDKKASGTVTFRNLSDQEIFIPMGTIVRTNSDPYVRFETKKEAILEPGVESQIDVPIVSTIAGTNGNVLIGSITAVENDLGGNIVVSNQSAISGGSDKKTLAPTEKDYEKLKKELMEILIKNSIDEMRKNTPNAFLIAEETIKINEIITEERIPAVGDPAERHTLKIKASLSGWMIEKEAILKSVNLAMDADLSGQFLHDEKDIEIELIRDSVKFKNNELFWVVESSRRITAKIDENKLVQNILGREINTAKSLIGNDVDLSKEPIIEISPSFWRYLPFFPFRINMVIDGN